MKARGFTVLAATWFFLLFSAGLMTTAHFIGQRLRVMKRLDQVERRIHKLHREDFKGKRKFWPHFDQPTNRDRKRHLTRRRQVKKHNVSINFGK